MNEKMFKKRYFYYVLAYVIAHVLVTLIRNGLS